MEKQFSPEDIKPLLERIENIDSVTIVGGQAVNFWATRYMAVNEEILKYQPFTSRDLDFSGDRNAVKACAKAWKGECFLPDMSESTPNSGKVVAKINEKSIEVDFLEYTPPVTSSEIKKFRAAFSEEIGGRYVRFHVMHPLHCLRTRLWNVYGPLKRKNRLSMNQVRISICVLHSFIEDIVNYHNDKRGGLETIEILFKIAEKKEGLSAFFDDSIDILDAISRKAGLPKAFWSKRHPQALLKITEKRKRYGKRFGEIMKSRKQTDVQPMTDFEKGEPKL